MPRGDGTGPEGAGPMTGRGAGFCDGNDVPGFRGPGRGRGFGFGMGRGRSFGGGRGLRRGLRGWWGPGSGRFGWSEDPDNAREDPQVEKGYLKRQLEGIKQRLSELEGSGPAD